MAKPSVLPYGKMEHFSIIFIFIRARTYTRGNISILAKINVIVWIFRGWYFVKNRTSAREGPVDFYRETFYKNGE